MDKQLVSDYFETYDRAFCDVCKVLNLKKLPTWKHIWLFRYLQLSYSRYVLEMCNEGRWDLKIKESLPELIKLEKIYSIFPMSRSLEFADWWFPDGMRFFYRQEKLEFTEIGSLVPHNKFVTREDYWTLRDSFENYMARIYGDRFGPPALIIGFNISNSKKQILSEFEEFLNQNSIMKENYISMYQYNFENSKIKEKTLKDCFRALEIRAIYPEIDLLEVAKISNTLDQSLSGIGRDAESNQSIRSGISRQIKLALRISENAARGIFPSSDEYNWTLKFEKELLKFGGIQNYFDYFVFHTDDDYQEIYEDIMRQIKLKISVMKDIS